MSTSASDVAAQRRAGRTFLGLLRALVPALVILLFLVWWQRGEPQQLVPVDPTGDIAYAQRVSPVPLPAPAALPADWRATSARVDAPAGEKRSPVTLTIGYLTADEKYAEVSIGDRGPRALVEAVTPQASRDGSAPVGAASWDRYRTERGETVLVGPVGRATVLVTGNAAEADLARLATAVR